MRIGILSLNPGLNYGGILQSFALKTELEKMGHDTSIICKDVYKREPDLLHYLSRIIRMIKNRSSWQNTVVLERVYNRKIHIIRHNVDRFMQKYLHRTMISCFCDIKEYDFDCIVVGSDQVWRPIYFESQYLQPIENAFLSFTNGWNIKRVAYAASFGIEDWEYNVEQTKNCRGLLQQFDAVSVREDSGVDLCKNKFCVNACKVIDPTLLLTGEDYIKIIDFTNIPKSKGNLFVYILDKTDELDRLVEKVADDKSLIPFEIVIKHNQQNPKDNIYPPVESWIQGFRDAEFVITDSFHACVFSLLFHKPFLVVGNKERGMTRFTSFLSQFGLEKCMVFDFQNYKELESVDFTYADSILADLRIIARNFLKSI